MNRFHALTAFVVFAIAGCAAERPANMPASAMLMGEGTGTLSSSAPQDGEVYVWDQNDNQLLYQARVAQGEMVSIEPERDTISVAGKTVSEKNLSDGHRYRIFFNPEAQVTSYRETTVHRDAPRETVREQTTVERHDRY